MSDQISRAGNLPNTPSYNRTQRIQTFITILALLSLAFTVLGLLDLHDSPVTLILVMVAYAYYAIYYLLLRAGYGVPATYVCIGLLLVLIGVGIHNSGGFLLATNVLYLVLPVSAGIVLNDERAIDVVMVLCMVGYGALVLFELATPPAVLMRAYANTDSLVFVAVIVTMFSTLLATWLLMRNSVAGLRRSTSALERARAEAEARARENAALVEQIQVGNQSLLATQARLRDTIEVLTLPLIPLDHGVALLPLIGYLDETRAERLVNGLLYGIQDQRARTVILDITGLREVDAHVATALVHAASAARLLGANVVLSGVGASAARALIDLDADVSSLRTVARLSDALRMVSAAGATS